MCSKASERSVQCGKVAISDEEIENERNAWRNVKVRTNLLKFYIEFIAIISIYVENVR